MKEYVVKVPVQSLIDHIKTAVDVDPWAKEMAEELLKEQEPLEPVVDSFMNRRCPKCNAVLKGKFCFECGQAVTWR